MASLIVLFVVYMATEIEALNAYPSIIYYKCFLSVPPCIYNEKKFLMAYKERDYIKAVGFTGITALYCLFVWTLGGGGR